MRPRGFHHAGHGPQWPSSSTRSPMQSGLVNSKCSRFLERHRRTGRTLDPTKECRSPARRPRSVQWRKMNWATTQPSLLSRLRDPEDHAAWQLFDRRYGDLITRYCRRRGLQHADTEDVRQLVLLGLASAMRSFRYDPTRGRFGSYVGRAVRNAIIRLRQCPPGRPQVLPDLGRGLLDNAPAEDGDACDSEWERCWREHHLRRAFQTLRQTYAASSLAVFQRLLDGAPTTLVAQEFDMADEAVKKIRQRVRARLQEVVARQLAEEELSRADADFASESPDD